MFAAEVTLESYWAKIQQVITEKYHDKPIIIFIKEKNKTAKIK